MVQPLTKRDRYARRPDKVWRSGWLQEMLLPRQYDVFDRFSIFWYNRDTTATMEIKDDNASNTQKPPHR